MGIKELVNAFNLNNYGVVNVNTNFTVEGKKIVGLFASGTNTEEYLRRIGEEIIKWHYNGESEVAGEYYNLNYFPFVNSGKEKYIDENVKKVELTDSTNNEVIRNLKVHFANEFKKAVRSKVAACLQKEVGISEEEAYEWVNETVGTGAIGKPYLYCIAFSNEYLKREYDLETFEFFKQAYIKEFNSRLKECHVKSSDFYEYKDDMLYVKNVSDKVIKSVTEYVKKEVAFDFRTPGTEDSKVENFKDVLGDFIFKWTGKSINAYEYDVFTDKKKIENGNDFVLIPLTKRYSGQLESLKHKDAYKINTIHKDFVSDIRGKTAKPDVTSYENPVYAISNKRIAQLLPEIMQSPIAYNQINGRFEFAVDLENFKRRGSSRSSSTVTSPTHAEPPRTPPEQTGARFFESEGDRDSGIGDSPPKPKDSGSSSGGPGPSTELSYMEWESPMRSQGEELEGPPRRGLEEVHMLPLGTRGVPGTSKEFSPRTYIGSATVVSGSSSSVQSVSAAKNVQAGTSARAQPMNRWSLPVFYAQSSDISVPRFQPPTQLSSSGPSLWKDAAKNVQAGTSQPMNHWSSPAPSAGLWSLLQSRSSSWKGANPVGANPWVQQTNHWSLQSSNLKEDCKKICEDFEEAYEKIVSDSSLSKEEQELFKELLYVFNLNNQILECHHTNFIVKNGKIASLINDGVNVKEYLQKVRDYTIKEYRFNKKEVYDLNEFPFKFLSNCEKNQETTVVANISCGALFNLKKLFIQEHEKKVEIEDIDINIVKKAVKSKKDKWVDSQVQQGMARPCEAIKTCYPDESVLESIPIIKGKDKYYLDRTFRTREVESFLKERRCAEGTSKAEKMKSEDNKDSGYSSGFVTDAENVSSEAKATISGSSGYESVDCENTRGGSPKRTLELSMRMEELAISTDLDATKVEQHSPIKKFRSN
ncbi:MAG: hypothetical protein ABS808_01525 [Wolbachia endosymbiont of Polyergus mexicanus]|uniref:Uncharacterized protein n=1 Tax=Wolbachia endosymbiont of Polyergus mexicanus TaxID=3171167 RepID=A0AAU7YL48_9RICK